MVWQRSGKEISSVAISSGHIKDSWEGTPKRRIPTAPSTVFGTIQRGNSLVSAHTERRVSGEKGLLVYQKSVASEISFCATVKVTYFRACGPMTLTFTLSLARDLMLTRTQKIYSGFIPLATPPGNT